MAGRSSRRARDGLVHRGSDAVTSTRSCSVRSLVTKRQMDNRVIDSNRDAARAPHCRMRLLTRPLFSSATSVMVAAVDIGPLPAPARFADFLFCDVVPRITG